jgi:hypothetical protein
MYLHISVPMVTLFRMLVSISSFPHVSTNVKTSFTLILSHSSLNKVHVMPILQNTATLIIYRWVNTSRMKFNGTTFQKLGLESFLLLSPSPCSQQKAFKKKDKSSQESYLRKWAWEVITVLVHKVITVTTKIFPKLSNYPLYIIFSKICVSDMNRLPATSTKYMIQLKKKITYFHIMLRLRTQSCITIPHHAFMTRCLNSVWEQL